MNLNKNNETENIEGDKVFERTKVKIKVGNLVDDESMFYNPYKKGVTFKSVGGSKVLSKDYVI